MIYVFVFYSMATNLQVIDERLFNKDKWLFKEFYVNANSLWYRVSMAHLSHRLLESERNKSERIAIAYDVESVSCYI